MNDPLCEYQRCGGMGKRAVAQPRAAHKRVRIGDRVWHVCESCAHLLKRLPHSRASTPADQDGAPVPISEPLRTVLANVESHRLARPPRPQVPRPSRPPDDSRAADLTVENRGTPRPPSNRQPRPHESFGTVAHPTVATDGDSLASVPLDTTQLFARHHTSEARLLALLTRSKCSFVDNRAKGGVLWLLGGPELKPLIDVCRKLGYSFHWQPHGGKQTKGAPGWWSKVVKPQ